MSITRPNVILIALDTMRAGHMSCCGYPRKTTPNLDRFAQDAVLFTCCINHSAHTLPSFTTLFTSLEPATHECPATLWNTKNEARQRLDDRVPTMAEILSRWGYTTIAVDDLISFGCGPHWFAKGWEYYINLRNSATLKNDKIRLSAVNRRAIEWLKSNISQPFFMFLHPWDTHQGYNPSSPFKERFQDFDADLKPTKTKAGGDYIRECGPVSALLSYEKDSVNRYDGEYAQVDHYLGEFFEILWEMKLYDDTLIIIWSDHGDDMAEHHCNFEHRECYDAILNVPLIIKYPKSYMGSSTWGKVVESLVSNSDILPTILEFLSIEMPESEKPIDGRSLNDLALGKETSVRKVVLSTGCWMLGDDNHWKAVEVSARTENYRLIRRADIGPFIPYAAAHPIMKFQGLVRQRGVPAGPELFQSLPKIELFDIKNDPEEQVNCADVLPDVLKEMDSYLMKWRNSKAIAM